MTSPRAVDGDRGVLIPFRGRCSFFAIHAHSKKPNKYGLKIFWACDSENSYPIRGIPYLGKDKRGPRPKSAVGLGETTVVELTKGFKRFCLKYIGVTFDRSLSFNIHITNLNVINKARKGLTAVKTMAVAQMPQHT